jgi:hypothetical protein
VPGRSLKVCEIVSFSAIRVILVAMKVRRWRRENGNELNQLLSLTHKKTIQSDAAIDEKKLQLV